MKTLLSIPAFRAVHLVPYVRFLRDVGTPVDRLLSKAKLPTMFEDDLQAYLPLLPTLDFLASASHLDGIRDLGLATINHVDVSDLNQGFLATLSATPTLQQALTAYCRMGSIENTNVVFWLEQDDALARACAVLDAPGPRSARRCAEWSQNMTLVAVIQACAGPNWYPGEMAFTSNEPVTLSERQQFPNTRFLLGQRYTWVDLSRDLLAMPPRPLGVTITDPRYEPVLPGNFSDSLKRLLKPYLRDGYPHIELAAEISGTSVRTLQRRLAAVGSSYSELLQQARFEAARQLIADPDIKLIDAAYHLGWSCPATFSRAFRQFAGVSPSEFRNAHKRVLH